MYTGVLQYLGLHSIQREPNDDSAGELIPFGFSEPDSSNSLGPTWRRLYERLDEAEERTALTEVARAISVPPYGVKDGIIPILLVTALLLRGSDVALFREGTYQARLTTEVAELIQSNPSLFAVKAAPAATGQRKVVLDLLSNRLLSGPARPGSTLRNPAILRVANALLDYARGLTQYAARTKRISREAQAIRTALLSANDPIGLIFTDLPQALGYTAIAGKTKSDKTAAAAFVTSLADGLLELRRAPDDLRDYAQGAVAKAFRLPPALPELRAGLGSTMAGFTNATLEPSLRGFVSIATNAGLPDEDWLDPLVVRIAEKPLSDWTDESAQAFPQRAELFARAFDRVSHLYDTTSTPPRDGVTIPTQTQLLTLTTPAGQETRTLVRVPEDSRARAAVLAREVLKRAQEELGPDGGRILLAALAEELMDLSDLSATMVPEGSEANV